jgi:undecaprenyl-diphosphatase
MSYLHACVLGLLQGLAEFLPISSSGHLALAPWLFGWPDPGLTFDIALHAGTLLALALYFWRDWFSILSGSARDPKGSEARLLAMLVLATLPAVAAGLLFEKQAETLFRGPARIAVNLIVFALLMEAADRFGRRARELSQLGWSGAALVGCAQALSIMPGVSRSGSTLTGGLALGLTRVDAARFSFLLSAPITFGACVLKLRHLTGADLTGPFIAGVATSAVSGLFAVGFFMARIRATGTRPYTLYRLALGALVLALGYRG